MTGMPLFEMTDADLRRIEPTTFEYEDIKERQDLQRILKNHIADVAPNCKVISEEFSSWEDAQRRIDLLCVDSDGNLVVVELKREIRANIWSCRPSDMPRWSPR